MSIHPTAILAEGAQVPASCIVGPYCTIGPNVILGEECELVSHVVLDGHLTAGARNRFYSFACVGIAPQDLKYRNEPTGVELGDDNVIREYVTISRGTAGGGGATRIGSNCLIMAYAHIGHDSIIGSHCILANAATLAGHVIVEDFATVGALCPVHQFCHIGRYAYIGGGTTITQDVLPYSLTSARRETHAYGLNKVGLERRGFSRERLRAIQHAYRLLLAAKMNTSQAIEKLRSDGIANEDVAYLVEFIERSERGVLK
ncbi:acyl-ACP--UDP-N-acetylglucosamine O-acyltransferase [Acidipila rosea]|uniref:Acyl-[acyl-carrier-protein]--UDP-N-acetylglucosamine O-acyltransferase n=1 Tax=Acidipila rosea TaxID=768535 RepID=A0A4R1L298_9BACT|nr:acyl-ACP--UDP-N-acetylglucosamine O-acyltransferase [Acidipila rosea]MBW4027911.1 acyl-ACP--UDP-N-acetylglucosamine O-acyltransferase [Acidobacteriota bacterium]MBW4045284.1 acyl-ACP--UDP-N-acetylglucosamine O-acyltransferase [Acidobacteriota bacterium]TCK72122.1 acyl-[acyl-carrier-protein]--UDP-N-acetylglucosamine O-acyltransferase [Acidipila rosea]